jgi:hypothetical protein
MQLAKKRKQWPVYQLPKERGDITVADVLVVKPGLQRDEMIDTWCASVWKAFQQNHKQIEELVQKELYPYSPSSKEGTDEKQV